MKFDNDFYICCSRDSCGGHNIQYNQSSAIQMVTTIIGITARPEKRKELSLTLNSIIDHVKKEHGCLFAALYHDVENENNLMVVEKWASQKDTDEHLRSDIFMVLRGTESLMLSPLDIIIHTI